jgi:glycosyltransferase involved in cell wall biosynthesis
MMPAYNAGRFIDLAIQSVLAQTYADWELLVVDDGSTDATAEVAGRFRDPRIRLFTKGNGGESTARNVALDHARGEFMAFVDADDAYAPTHLEATIGFLQAHPECNAVYTDGLHIDELGNRLGSLQSRRRGPFEGRLFEHAVLASDIFGPPLCVVLRHDIIATRHLRYDDRIVIGPDWEFFIRCTEHARFGYLADQTCFYRVHRANITSRVARERRMASLALCREKAVKLESFGACSVQTRTAVFYDLLVNWLGETPARGEEVTRWKEFEDLPREEQSRLLRLMASEAIERDSDEALVTGWLRRARALNPADRRTRWLAHLYALSPALCQRILRVKSRNRMSPRDQAPFADLFAQADERPTP